MKASTSALHVKQLRGYGKMDKEKKYSLLIVDDQPSNIMMLANMLKSEYNIYAAKNGQSAISVATEKLPDVCSIL